MPRPTPPVPTEANLHEAALAHLARYGTTEAGLRRVLERRIARWAHAAGAGGEDSAAIAATAAKARAAAAAIAARLAAAGAVNDAAFAASRARRLTRAGRSARAVLAHLAAKGVGAETARAVLAEDGAAELTAALILVRKRRLGGFAAPADDGDDPRAARLAALAVLGRAGFSRDVAETALDMPAEEAEAAIRRGVDTG